MNTKLLSIQIGQPQTYTDSQGTWRTAFYKHQVPGPIYLNNLNLEGDAVANTENHGGSDQAVLLYSADHYSHWKAELGLELQFGAFAENLTIKGMDETIVYIDDIYQIGVVKLQVTKPRIPCWKISRRWNVPDLTKRVTQTKRTGWYCRVLQEGNIEVGLPVTLVSRRDTSQTVAQVFQTIIE